MRLKTPLQKKKKKSGGEKGRKTSISSMQDKNKCKKNKGKEAIIRKIQLQQINNQ